MNVVCVYMCVCVCNCNCKLIILQRLMGAIMKAHFPSKMLCLCMDTITINENNLDDQNISLLRPPERNRAIIQT